MINMNLKESEVEMLKKYSKLSVKEKVFRQKLTQYCENDLNPCQKKTDVLLIKEKLELFNKFNGKYLVTNYEYTPEDIEYFLEKNFILYRYAGEYNYLTLQSINMLYNHYNFLLTQNFENLGLTYRANPSLKPFLIDLYRHSLAVDERLAKKAKENNLNIDYPLSDNQRLTNNLITKKPDKIMEVSELLMEYNKYMMTSQENKKENLENNISTNKTKTLKKHINILR